MSQPDLELEQTVPWSQDHRVHCKDPKELSPEAWEQMTLVKNGGMALRFRTSRGLDAEEACDVQSGAG